MVVWPEAEVYCLIDLIRSHEFIWNTSSPDYKHKHKKTKFWLFAANQINKVFNRIDAPFDHKDCFKKWNNLRTYFQSESKSSKTRTENDPTESKRFISNTWKYSSRLSFLVASHLPNNISDGSFNNSKSSICEVDPYSLSEMESCDTMIVPESTAEQHQMSDRDKPNGSYPETTFNSKTESPNINKDPLHDEMSGRMTQQSNKEPDTPSYFFGRYVSQCLDKLDSDINLEARQRINEILFDCETRQLQRHQNSL